MRLSAYPPGYADLATFVQCAQAAGAWTAAAIALVEVITFMVFLVPKAYNSIKEKGERAERERMLAAMREAMRDAGVDDETRRRVEDDIARRRRNGR